MEKVETTDGYWWVWRPGHPVATKAGWALEHRIIAFEGGLLAAGSRSHVHHINHNRKDNRLENLVVLTRREHAALHGEERRILDPHEAARLYASGLTTVVIAQMLGSHTGNISRALAQVGMKARPWGPLRKDIDEAKVIGRLRAGEPVLRIARSLGCSIGPIDRIRRGAGIAPRPPGRPEG